jgi:hypothetical protein
MNWVLVAISVAVGLTSWHAEAGQVEGQAGPMVLVYSRENDTGAFREAATASDESRWITVADYPKPALKARREANLSVEVEVAADDHVLACRVVEGSEFAEFAKPICPLITSRGAFRHALDTNGNPAAGKVSLDVDYRFVGPPTPGQPVTVFVPPSPWEKEPVPATDTTLTIHGASLARLPNRQPEVGLDISAAGAVLRCTIRKSSGTDAGDIDLCQRMAAARFRPAEDKDGKPVWSVGFFTLTLLP